MVISQKVVGSSASSAVELRERALTGASRVIVGHEDTLEHLLIALLVGGHVLLEGVPGTAKTLMARTLALLMGGDFTRVQFTPDLMPSDILGTSVFDMQTSRFHLKHGPIFTNFLLADEINRAPAKTQAALLEAMEETQVSLDGVSHRLPDPFIVIATQNPIEYEGTYPLPEAQLDRFAFKLLIEPGSEEMEQTVLHRYNSGFDARRLDSVDLDPVIDLGSIKRIRQACREVTVDDTIVSYITALTRGSRDLDDVLFGASTRAAVILLLASKARAALRGSPYVLPDDVKALARPTLRHRLLLEPEAELDGVTTEQVIDQLLATVEVPR